MSKEIYEGKTPMDNENIRISTLASKFPKGSIYIEILANKTNRR